MKFEESMLSGYLDNELTPEERVFVERYLESNPKDRETLRALTSIRDNLASLPLESFSTNPVEAIRKRIAQELASPNVNGLQGADSSHSAALTTNARSASLETAKSASSISQVPLHVTKHSARTLWVSLAMAAVVLLVVGYFASPAIRNVAVSNRVDPPMPHVAVVTPSENSVANNSPADSVAMPQPPLADVAADPSAFAPSARAMKGTTADPTFDAMSIPGSRRMVGQDAQGGVGGSGAVGELTIDDSTLGAQPSNAQPSKAQPSNAQPSNSPSRFLVYHAESGDWSIELEPTSNPADYLERSLVIDMPTKQVAGIIDWVADQLHTERAPADSYQSALGEAPQTLAIYVETDASQAASLVQSLIQISKTSSDSSHSKLINPSALARGAGDQQRAGLAASHVALPEPTDLDATERGAGATSSKLAPPGNLAMAKSVDSPSLILGTEIDQAVQQGKLWIIIRPVTQPVTEKTE